MPAKVLAAKSVADAQEVYQVYEFGKVWGFCNWPAATPPGRTLDHNHLVGVYNGLQFQDFARIYGQVPCLCNARLR